MDTNSDGLSYRVLPQNGTAKPMDLTLQKKNVVGGTSKATSMDVDQIGGQSVVPSPQAQAIRRAVAQAMPTGIQGAAQKKRVPHIAKPHSPPSAASITPQSAFAPLKPTSPSTASAQFQIPDLTGRGDLVSAILRESLSSRKPPSSAQTLALLKVGKTIESLDLHGLSITAKELASLAKTFPNLSTLNLNNCSLDDDCIAEINKFSKLKSLDYSNNSAVTVVPTVAVTRTPSPPVSPEHRREDVFEPVQEAPQERSASPPPEVSEAHRKEKVAPEVAQERSASPPPEVSEAHRKEKVAPEVAQERSASPPPEVPEAHRKEKVAPEVAQERSASPPPEVSEAHRKEKVAPEAPSKPKVTELKAADLMGRGDIFSAIIREAKTKGTQIPAPLLREMKLAASSIHSLDLHDLALTADDLAKFAAFLPNVRTLNLKNCSLSDTALAQVFKFAHLENVDMSANADLTYAAIRTLAGIKKLKSLALIGCTAISQVKDGATLFEKLMALKPPTACLLGIMDALRKTLAAQEETALATQEKMMLNILNRTEQIQSAGIEERALSPEEALHLSIFIEARLPALVEKGEAVFTNSAYKIPRTLQYSSAGGGAVYLIAKHKFSIPTIKGEGTFKKVSAAAQLKFNEFSKKPPLFARALTKDTIGGTRPVTEEDVANAEREVVRTQNITKAISKNFPGYPLGIVPVHTVRNYTTVGAKGNVAASRLPKLSFISPAFDGNLENLRETKGKNSLTDLVQIARGAGLGLWQLHAVGYVHGDFKEANCVYKKNPVTGRIDEAAIIDLGSAYHHERGIAVDQTKVGPFYGSPRFTSPEHLGRAGFNGDCRKLDVFALGFALYEQCFGVMPPWDEEIVAAMSVDSHTQMDSYTKTQELNAIRAEMVAKIKNTVDNKLQALLQKATHTTLTQEEKMHCLIYKALLSDPAKRITMEAFMKELNQIAPQGASQEPPKAKAKPQAAPQAASPTEEPSAEAKPQKLAIDAIMAVKAVSEHTHAPILRAFAGVYDELSGKKPMSDKLKNCLAGLSTDEKRTFAMLQSQVAEKGDLAACLGAVGSKSKEITKKLLSEIFKTTLESDNLKTTLRHLSLLVHPDKLPTGVEDEASKKYLAELFNASSFLLST